MTESQLLSQLDSDQRVAVTAPLQNCLCIANAGSGKTRVLVYRIAYWIMKGVPEESFMMLTFTKKAAEEMTERIKKLLGKNSIKITNGTFHRVAWNIMKKHGYISGLTDKDVIICKEDALSLMNLCRNKYCAEHNLHRDTFVKKEDIMDALSYARNTCVRLDDHLLETGRYLPEDVRHMLAICKDYEHQKKLSSLSDFDDVLVRFNNLLDDHRFKTLMHNRFPHIFVDEYQDINHIQDEIIHKLSNGSLTAVGDPAQCIYGFRGSEAQFIQDFDRHYANATVYPIRNNYRSVQGVINLALEVINRSPDNLHRKKEMFCNRPEQILPVMCGAFNDVQQAKYIVAQVKDAHARGIPYREMAVLIRNNRMSKYIEAEMMAANIPFALCCGVGFYESLHIRALMHFLKFLHNHNNQVSFWELFETAEGIGPKTAQKMFEAFENNGFNLDALMAVRIQSRAQRDFNLILACIKRGFEMVKRKASIRELLTLYYENYYKDKMPQLFENVDKRQMDIEILMNVSDGFSTIEEFVNSSTLSRQDETPGRVGDLLICTMHRAKGLEWDKVFLPYMNQHFVPGKRSIDEKLTEDERRLLYVAITRARKELDIIHIRDCLLGGYSYFDGEPSVFLHGLPPGITVNSRVYADLPALPA